jgi:hypothetical protein
VSVVAHVVSIGASNQYRTSNVANQKTTTFSHRT